ncbi:MAG: hypothetical protein ACXVZ4_07605 [Gaiellaceae bacterium]
MRRLFPLGLLAALLAALAAGCGGGVTLDPVAQAATKTADAGSFRFEYTLAVAGASMNGSGAYDEPNKRMQMGFTFAAGSQVPAGMTMDMILDTSSGLIGYLRMPLISAFLPNGKSWIKFDLTKEAKAQGVDLSQLANVTQADPRQTLDLLKQVGSSQELGHEQVNGAATTHYRVTVEAQKLIDAQPTDAAKEAMRKALAQANIESFPIDVWVGDDGFLRRLEFALPQAGGMKLTENLTGFGSDVTVDLPPESEVYAAPAK